RDFVIQQGGDAQRAVDVFYRLVLLGPRVPESRVDEDRLVAGVKGVAGGWEYEAAVTYTANRAVTSLASGYVDENAFRILLNAGALDPFGNHDEAVAATLASIEVT